jgi:hypothetical protein
MVSPAEVDNLIFTALKEKQTLLDLVVPNLQLEITNRFSITY